MAIGINWADIWAPVWGPVWSQTAPEPEAEQPERNSGGWFYDFEQHRERWKNRERQLEEAEESAKQLESRVDREIAELLQQDERKAAFQENISRISRLVAGFADSEAEQAMSARAAQALARARAQESVGTLLALQREMDRMLEEEEFAVLMMLVAD